MANSMAFGYPQPPIQQQVAQTIPQGAAPAFQQMPPAASQQVMQGLPQMQQPAQLQPYSQMPDYSAGMQMLAKALAARQQQAKGADLTGPLQLPGAAPASPMGSLLGTGPT